MKRIFISYSRVDEDFARKLAEELAAVGVDVWIDYEDIPAGQKWSTAIQDGLRSSDGMLVIISPDAMASSNVEDEWQYFMDRKHPVIPVLWRPAEVHFQLHRLQYVDFHNHDFGDAFAKLIDELNDQGLPLNIQTGEDTWIYAPQTYQRETDPIPPKDHEERIREHLQQSQAQSAQSAQTGHNRIPLIMGAIAILLMAGAAMLIASTLMGDVDDSSQAQFGKPMPRIMLDNEVQVHIEQSATSRTFMLDGGAISSRFPAGRETWYQIDHETDETGYQVEASLIDQTDISFAVLRSVPVYVELLNSEIILYAAPDWEAATRDLTVSRDSLYYGFIVDDDEDFWYRVEIVTDADDDMVGWLPQEESRTVDSLPAIGYTDRTTDSYWGDEGESVAYTLRDNTEVRVFAAGDKRYYGAVYVEGAWQVVWIDFNALEINDETGRFID